MATRPDFNRTYTLEEFYELMEDSDEEYELINGKLWPRPLPPGPDAQHGKILARLSRFLGNFVEQHGLGEIYVGSVCTFGRADHFPQVDLCYLANEQLPAENANGPIAVVPKLIAEVHSGEDTIGEIDEKMKLYEAAEVPLIWSIYPHMKYVMVYQLDKPRLIAGVKDELDGGDVLRGLKIELSELFR